MRIYRLWMALSLAFVAVAGFARNNPYDKSLPKSPKAQYRDVCANSESQIDQSINNVRARLLGGGDCWWTSTTAATLFPRWTCQLVSQRCPLSSPALSGWVVLTRQKTLTRLSGLPQRCQQRVLAGPALRVRYHRAVYLR
jgi:hypothetical protein